MPTHYVLFSPLEQFCNPKEREGAPKNNGIGRHQENIEDVYIQFCLRSVNQGLGLSRMKLDGPEPKRRDLADGVSRTVRLMDLVKAHDTSPLLRRQPFLELWTDF
ncbi:hypothetical protein EJB05_47035, partial [Eragrostis curvula]